MKPIRGQHLHRAIRQLERPQWIVLDAEVVEPEGGVAGSAWHQRRRTLGPGFRRHRIFTFSWAAQWWCRDEYLGTLALNRSVTPESTPATLREFAQRELDWRATLLVRSGLQLPWDAPAEEFSQRQREREIELARRALPFPSTVYRLKIPEGEIAVLFFRPGESLVALYDPLFGTATARTSATDDPQVVITIARALGLRPESARLDPRPDTAEVVRG
jgi:hypothetical protein